MKFSINHSETLLGLLKTGEAQVDAVEWVDKLSLDRILQARKEFPGLDFHFHPGRMRFTRKGVAHLQAYLKACPQSPHISIHLAPLPALWTYAAMHWKVFLPDPNASRCIRRFVKQVQWLKQRAVQPVILENMPVLHPSRYRFESDPIIISQVLAETDCSLLLDLAHARIAAEARQMNVEAYLASLPLEKVAQIHLAGVRRDNNGRLYDAHAPLQEEDYRLLEWTLERTKPAWLTLEYFTEDKQALIEQLDRLQSYL